MTPSTYTQVEVLGLYIDTSFFPWRKFLYTIGSHYTFDFRNYLNWFKNISHGHIWNNKMFQTNNEI